MLFDVTRAEDLTERSWTSHCHGQPDIFSTQSAHNLGLPPQQEGPFPPKFQVLALMEVCLSTLPFRTGFHVYFVFTFCLTGKASKSPEISTFCSIEFWREGCCLLMAWMGDKDPTILPFPRPHLSIASLNHGFQRSCYFCPHETWSIPKQHFLSRISGLIPTGICFVVVVVFPVLVLTPGSQEKQDCWCVAVAWRKRNHAVSEDRVIFCSFPVWNRVFTFLKPPSQPTSPHISMYQCPVYYVPSIDNLNMAKIQSFLGRYTWSMLQVKSKVRLNECQPHPWQEPAG